MRANAGTGCLSKYCMKHSHLDRLEVQASFEIHREMRLRKKHIVEFLDPIDRAENRSMFHFVNGWSVGTNQIVNWKWNLNLYITYSKTHFDCFFTSMRYCRNAQGVHVRVGPERQCSSSNWQCTPLSCGQSNCQNYIKRTFGLMLQHYNVTLTQVVVQQLKSGEFIAESREDTVQHDFTPRCSQEHQFTEAVDRYRCPS